jgi:hypothetical protein
MGPIARVAFARDRVLGLGCIEGTPRPRLSPPPPRAGGRGSGRCHLLKTKKKTGRKISADFYLFILSHCSENKHLFHSLNSCLKDINGLASS